MAQFRVIPAFKRVIASYISDFDIAFHMSWPWMAIGTAGAVYAFLEVPGFVTALVKPETLTNDQALGLLPALCAVYGFLITAYASIAVNWHRYLLLSDVAEGWQRLRLDFPVWRYLGNFLLFVLLITPLLLVVLVAAFILGFLSGAIAAVLSGFLNVVAFIIVGGWFMACIYRLTIKFPAIAIEEEYGFRDAWRETKHNLLRLAGYAVLCMVASVPFVLFTSLPQWLHLIVADPSDLAQFLAWLVSMTGTWAAGIFNLTCITMLFAIFGQGEEV